MTKHHEVEPGPFGQPLSADALKQVRDVRQKITQPIHPNFDNDFNIYRFVLNAERSTKTYNDTIDAAVAALNNHLRLRKCLNLDELPDIPFAENPIFKKKYLPWGEIQRTTDNANRLLQFVEYKTITVEYIAHALKSSDACRFQFWQFEHILRRVNENEQKTGKFSSIRHIVDMNNYEINPFTMLFVSSGTLQYYSHLFHYENYPELVYPVEMVNIAKWIFLPYKLIKSMMPAGFSDRFRLYDGHYLSVLDNQIQPEDIPESLGGQNTEIKCHDAVEPSESERWTVKTPAILDALETLVIHSKKLKYYRIDVSQCPTEISWYFHTDSDVYFGIFYEPFDSKSERKPKKEREDVDTDTLDMVYPWFKLTAKLVHEYDAIRCSRAGHYYVVFSNKHSWLHKRTVELMIQVRDADGLRRVHHHGDAEVITEDELDIAKSLDLAPMPTN